MRTIDKINSSRATRNERQNPYEHQNASASRWDLEDAAEEPEPVEVALNRVTRDEVRLRSEPHCKAPWSPHLRGAANPLLDVRMPSRKQKLQQPRFETVAEELEDFKRWQRW